MVGNMSNKSFDFRIGSLNVRGMNKHSKRISVFNWINKQSFIIMFLQETFGGEGSEDLWKSEWWGHSYWAHGSNHSRGVSILIRKGFDFDHKSITLDPHGRYIIAKCLIQGEEMSLVNIYAPNVQIEKQMFYKSLKDRLSKSNIDINDKIIIGGDWNTITDPKLDKSGGIMIESETVTDEMKSLLLDFDLTDIWRQQHPETKRFTFRQRKPLIQTRLDYFMISNLIIDMVEKAQILSSFCSDHSCISL